MATMAFVVSLLCAGWLILRGGGSALALEGLLVSSLWCSSTCSKLLSSSLPWPYTLALGGLCGAFVSLLYYFAQGKGHNRSIRLIVLNLGATSIFIGSHTGAFILSTEFRFTWSAILLGTISPIVVYLLLAHSRLGLLMRAAGSEPDLVRRLGYRVWAIQASTFALAGLLIGLVATAKADSPLAVVGFGYAAYLILEIIRYLLNHALKSLNEA